MAKRKPLRPSRAENDAIGRMLKERMNYHRAKLREEFGPGYRTETLEERLTERTKLRRSG